MKLAARLLTLMALALLTATPTPAQDIFGSSAVGGPLWGPHRETLRLNAEAAAAKYNYCPTGGCVVRLESIDLKPAQARRGHDIVLTTTYTILTPEKVAIPVTLSREIFFQGKSLGKVKSIDTRNHNGTWTHHITFSLPKESPSGIYSLVTKVSTGYGSDLKKLDFLVE